MAEMTLNQILGTKNSGKMTLIGKETGKVYDFPFINSVSVKTDAKESDYAYANGITKKVTFAGEKDGSISFKTDLYTIELLSFITSSPITVGETEVFKTEIFEIEHIIRMDEMIDKETLRRSINNYNNIDMEPLL